MKCRHCFGELDISFADLGNAPPSNAYISAQNLNAVEKWFPLNVKVCSSCWLAQTEDYTGREELFSPDYAYFSSYSTTWLEHCKSYTAQMIERFQLGTESMIGEIASNDGYLLQYFQEKNIPCYGVEPTHSTANVAREKGLEVFENFFGVAFAKELVTKNYAADLLIANNVLAHVPDINDFVSGFTSVLKPNGVATFEFPHLYKLVTESQFDTIYHEHFSYLSFSTVVKIFDHNGLQVFDVEELPTHGGSLRVFAQRKDTGIQEVSHKVHELLKIENEAGMSLPDFYRKFQHRIFEIKREFLGFLLEAQKRNEKVMGYGAAAKGNTLLNYSGVRPDLLQYVVDRNPAKQNSYLPGSHIPVVSEEILKMEKPQWVVILPWNLRDEITSQLSYVREWGAKFVTAIPSLAIF
jgi:SAM-dependent methyltransferase